MPKITLDRISVEKEFAKALKEHGLILKDAPKMDGKWHRVAVDEDKTGQLSGSYRGFFDDGLPNGQMMNFQSGDKAARWEFPRQEIDPAEIAQQRAKAGPRKEQQSKDLQAQYKQTAKRAYGIYSNAAQAPADHPYLQRKGVSPDGELRMDGNGSLLVPMRDEKGYLWNVQIIQQDGTKRYLKDGRKSGLMHLIKGKGSPTIIAEGYATAWDINCATGLPVIMAFDAGNLENIAATVRQKSPDRSLVIAADDDHKLEAKTRPLPNTGIVHAQQAAQAVEGRMIVPPLTATEKAKGLSDYNDLRQERGKQALADILSKQLQAEKAKTKSHSAQPLPVMGL